MIIRLNRMRSYQTLQISNVSVMNVILKFRRLS